MMKTPLGRNRPDGRPDCCGLCADEHALGPAAKNAGRAKEREAGGQDREVLVNGRPEHRQEPRRGEAQKKEAAATHGRGAGQWNPAR
jgi:hypothetical protein